MSTVAAAPEGAGAGQPASSPSSSPPGARPGLTNTILGLGLAAGLLLIAFVSSGGVDQTSASAGNTWTEMALTVLGAGAVGGAAWGAGRRRAPAWGARTVGLMAALTALTGLSIIWSVAPDTSWSAANQMLSYLAAFAGAAALARLAPARWRALLGGIVLAVTALSGWALLAKVFPATLAADNQVGRLQAPFGYWNAVGVIAALGLPVCLWAGARRDRGRHLAGLAVPAIALLVSAIVLSASRSADAVAILGIALWLAFVPLRLRSVAVLGAGAVGGAVVSGWGLAHSQLTRDGQLTPAMDSAGHSFGIVLLAVVVLSAVGGVALSRAIDRTTLAPVTRRRLAIGLIGLAGLLPVAAVAGLATSSRGLTGQISHGWSTLTSTRGSVNNNPGRVFQFGSSRPLYWHQGLDVGRHHLFKGVGALGYGTARLRYTTLPYKSDEAHSYIIETFADLGLVGIAVTLALLVAWGMAAARSLALGKRWESLTAERRFEREGLAAMAIVVVAFGIQSALDWTWYFSGVTVPALVCAGWLAGRGPLQQPVGWLRERRSPLDRPGAVAVALAVGVLALAGAWIQWQPQRSADQLAASEGANSNAVAFSQARAAISSDPLAYEPRFVLASLYQSVNEISAGREELRRAIDTQPENPTTWAQLGGFELQTGHPARAIPALRRVLALDHTQDPATKFAAAGLVQARTAVAAQRRRARAGS